MSSSSRIPGFYKLPPEERRSTIEEVADLVTEEAAALDSQALTLENADMMVENVIGTFGLPLAVGVNFVLNGQDLVVPMVVVIVVLAYLYAGYRLYRNARGPDGAGGGGGPEPGAVSLGTRYGGEGADGG